MLGHKGTKSQLPDGKLVPLGMEWLAKLILDEIHDHTANHTAGGDAMRHKAKCCCAHLHAPGVSRLLEEL